MEFLNLPVSKLAEELVTRLPSTRPMWHPLGFVSTTLFNYQTGTLKLHLWPQGERRSKIPDWPIHDHSFHISSRILLGEVGSLNYSITEGTTFRRYSVTYVGEDSELRPTEQLVDCMESARAVMKAGSRYELPCGTYHENVVPTTELALTLVFKSRAAKSPPNVIGTLAIPDLPLYQRTPYPISSLLTVVSQLSK